jgi:HK97 family phage prohead protease/HK97 family phage major capsid protein
MKTRDVEPPDDDESYEDFMDRCTDELDDDACQVMWDERAAKGIVRKTHAAAVAGMEFVMSDETTDRMDDVILSDGWDLANFKKNPIALFGHRSDFPIGKWSNLRVENKQLRGHLELAPEGTSERIDEIRRLIDAGILRAVSVGFRPLERQPIDEKADEFWGPFKFIKQELVETSLVSVPANPNALAVAKSLKISPETQQLVFAGHGRRNDTRRRGLTGGHADRKSTNGKGTTMSLAQRITDAEKRLLDKKDKLAAMHAEIGDGDYTDDRLDAIGKANADIAHDEKILGALRESERAMGMGSDAGGRSLVPAREAAAAAAAAAAKHNGGARPFSMAAKKTSPLDLLVRAGALTMVAHRDRISVDELRRSVYGEDEATRAVLEWQTKAASAPAMSTVAGWAQELVQQIVTDFMATLMPKSVYPRLSAMGLSLTFGRNGKIIIPTRSRTPTIAGSFVGEGLPIPVRQGAFTSQTLTPKKMAVITTWTREIDEHSIPAIEGLLRDAIQVDTAVSLDAILLDANPATAIRPAGILNGVSGLTPTAGGGFTALTGDIKALSGALLTGTQGNVRSPAWLMNPQQVNSAGLVAAPGAGVFPFRDEIGRGMLGGWPIIDSGTVPLGTVIAIDAADYVSVTGDGPRFEISDQATLHMEDTAPTDISTSGTPAVVAYPAKSMFQTDSLALRLILPINWTIRRSGTVAWVAGVTW